MKKFGFISVFIFLLKMFMEVYLLLLPQLLLPDFNAFQLFRASQHNTDQFVNVIAIGKGTITQQLGNIVEILNTILSRTPEIGIRSISEIRIEINTRKLDKIASTLKDVNNKSRSIKGSLNNMNGLIESIYTVTNSVNGKTHEVKEETEKLDRKMALIGTISNHYNDRIDSIKGNINLIKSRTDSARSMISDSDLKIEVTKRLADSLNAFADLKAQRIFLLGQI